jgi:uncharacterized protein involved in type VI secretion and phage assembly
MVANQVIAKPIVKLNGTNLSENVMNNLVELTVDTSLEVPDMFVLHFQDDEFELMDSSDFDLGKEVEIGFNDDRNSPVTIIKGEITGLEPHYDEEMNAWFTVRGYDKRHRLNRGTKVKTYLNQKDSDIVSAVCGSAGVAVQVESTPTVHKYVIQHNQTDLQFLQERAYRNGFELIYENDKLHFRKPASRTELTLTRGQQLRSFTPRLSAARQVNEVAVMGWDPVQKQEVVGTVSTSSSNPQIGHGKWGGQAAQAAFSGAAKYIEARTDVQTQGDAEKLAQSILDDINSGFVEAEGMAFGNPELRAGIIVELEKLGTRFSGKYVVTSATHVYNGEEGYNTYFRIEGKKPKLISELTTMPYADDGISQWYGVVPALVTNNNDPDNHGRVKVKFPWLSTQEESNWARLCAPGAGNERGMWWMPEVNDEVLVAFEQGDFNRPLILGGLWNGQDKSPETVANTVKGGKVVRRTIKSRLGHTIRFVDEDSEKYIEIVDSAQGTQIKLDAKTNELTITCKGDVKVNSKGKANIETTGNMDMQSKGNITIKGTGNVSIEASGQLTLKGAMVNIN